MPSDENAGQEQNEREHVINIQVVYPEDWLSIISGEESGKIFSSKEYRSKEIQGLAHVSKAQLNHLVQTECILPLKDTMGRGKVKIYSHQNLIEAMISRELLRLSIGIRNINLLLNFLRQEKWMFHFSVLFSESSLELERLGKMLRGKRDSVDLKQRAMHEGVIRMIKEGEVPKDLRKEHTVWEFLKLYPPGIADLVMALWFQTIKDGETENGRKLHSGCVLAELGDVLGVIQETDSQVIVNLSNLNRKAYYWGSDENGENASR